jgi:hypothetical protein
MTKAHQHGLILPLLMLILGLLTMALPSGAGLTGTFSALTQASRLSGIHEDIAAVSLIKGFSRPEELGAVNCPDTLPSGALDGISDPCSSTLSGLHSGAIPNISKTAYNQLTLSPSIQGNAPLATELWVNPDFASAQDIAISGSTSAVSVGGTLGSPPTIDIAWALGTSGGGVRPSSAQIREDDSTLSRYRKTDQQRLDAQLRLQTAFLQQLKLSAGTIGHTLSPEWAFSETQHLRHDPVSSGQRFLPQLSGCQCRCTAVRCKCNCNQASQWLSSAPCQDQTDGGSCRSQADGTLCTANAQQYCYLKGAARLSSRWAVSLYSPRATQGKACRPERTYECPLAPKTGSECACQFDWPKPLDESRLQHLSLFFANGNASARWLP